MEAAEEWKEGRIEEVGSVPSQRPLVPSSGYAIVFLVCFHRLTWHDIRPGSAATSPCCSGSCDIPAVRGRSAPVPRATAPPTFPGSPPPRNSPSALGQPPQLQRSKLHSPGSALVPPKGKEKAQKDKKPALLCAGVAACMRGGSNPDDSPTRPRGARICPDQPTGLGPGSNRWPLTECQEALGQMIGGSHEKAVSC